MSEDKKTKKENEELEENKEELNQEDTSKKSK